MGHIHNPNFRRLDVGMLMALHLMLEQRSLSAAAREIGLSQPALSHALAKMREIFEDDLLVRERNVLVPTPRAIELRDQLRALIPDLNGLLFRTEFDPGRSTRSFKIAITDHAGQVLLPGLLRQLQEQAPGVNTNIAIIPNRQTDLEALDDGEFDTRVGWLRSLPPQWRRRKICDDRIVLIGAPDNPALANGGRDLTPGRFAALNHVGLASERPIYPNLIDSFLSTHSGLVRNIVTRVSHFAIVPFIVSQSLLVAMFPERLARAFVERGIIVAVDPPLPFPDPDLSIAWHPRTHSDPGHDWLRKQIVAAAQEIDHRDIQ